MPGSLDKNLLSGYLNEELGIYLLRGLSTVAPVPRPQDAGIDAISTLLRQSSSRNLHPENTFYVQLKSHAIREIEFTKDEALWLMKLQLPYFVGSVNKHRSEISLYTSHHWLVESRHFQERAVTFVLSPQPPENEQAANVPRGSISHSAGEVLRLWLGPPIRTWTVSEIGRPEFLSKSYDVLKPHLETDDRNIRWRRLKYAELLDWETNEPPVRKGWAQASHGITELSSLPATASSEEVERTIYEAGLKTIFAELATPLMGLITHTLYSAPESDFSIVYKLVQFMRANNCDPACGDWLENEVRRKFPNLRT